jgi:hypothetical protein
LLRVMTAWFRWWWEKQPYALCRVAGEGLLLLQESQEGVKKEAKKADVKQLAASVKAKTSRKKIQAGL